jgi:hypothetical protein
LFREGAEFLCLVHAFLLSVAKLHFVGEAEVLRPLMLRIMEHSIIRCVAFGMCTLVLEGMEQFPLSRLAAMLVAAMLVGAKLDLWLVIKARIF